VAAIGQAYSHFGIKLSDVSADRIRSFLAANAYNKHGAHHYTAEEFGLDPTMVRTLFKDYVERFNLN
jgi:hypothetical protein